MERLQGASAKSSFRAGSLSCALALAVLAMLVVAGPASAAYIHPSESWGFGTDGTSKTEFQEENSFEELSGELEQIHINQATQELVAMWQAGSHPKQVGAFEIGGPELMTPRGGSSPQPVSGFCCWRVGLDESDTATAGRIYVSSLFAEEGPAIFGPDGEPLSGINFAPHPGFKGGVAVDREGNVFLVNVPERQIEEFEPAGGPPFRIFHLPQEASEGEPGALAYDKQTGDLFLASGQYVFRLTEEAEYEDPAPAKYHDISGQPELAIDSAAGILYLSDLTEYPENFNQGWRAYDIETGSLLETRTGAGGESTVRGIAVDESTHAVYTSNNVPSVRRIEEWRPVVVPDVTTGKPTGNATINGTVGLAGAGDVTECLFEYGPELNDYTNTKPCTPGAPLTEAKSVSAELTGLTAETTYHYRLVAANANGKSVGGDMTITPHRVEALTTGAAEEIGRSSAKLTGSYLGTGEATKYRFEWGTEPSTLSSSSSEEEEAATNGPTQISDVAEGLSPDTAYYYRVAADNAQGESKGDILHFRTLPAVQGLETQPATSVKPRSAELNASYVGDGTPTTYFFEWGTHRVYGNSTPVQDEGSPTGAQDLAPADISGLELETTYHYRVVATNASGTTIGPDLTFRTPPAVGGIELAATELESHTATLTGQYVGDGQETTYYYEWGTNSAYLAGKSQTFNAGSPTGTTQLESLPITDLLGGTTYHFHIVATNAAGTTSSRDTTFFTSTNVRGVVTLPATEITQDSVTLNAEFNGNGQSTHYYFEYGPTTAYGSKAPLPPGTDAGSPTGVTQVSSRIDEFTAYTTYHYRVVATNDEGSTNGNDVTFRTEPARVPDIQGTRTGNVAATAATLEAAINPEHWSTIYTFEYGPTAAYGQQTEVSDPIGEDHSFHPVDNAIGGLEPGTLYHFRVVATNFTGTAYGPDQTFATPGPPRVDLVNASAATPSSVHLSALVDPKSSATAVRFEYGPTTAYGASTAPIDVGSGAEDHQVDADIAGLTSATGYHYRVVATNAYGTAESRDQTFTTGQASPPRNGGKGVKCKKGFVKRKGKCVKKKHQKHKQRRHHRKGDSR